MLELGESKSFKEIDARKGVDSSYVSRMVNLTTLARDIVAGMLNDELRITLHCLISLLIRRCCGENSGS
ncbi:hypothetical protein [Nitrosomonas sp. Nm166]|uniref:hypothetical protein n=1 Tax=Nitrosomonas sp. Nm166 TaxID=1881054 RepID=UPI000AED8752|nr:hypothetical protein [Nitrosomonas sp. Nm166]